MPDLPTISVTSAQATRIQAAFGGVEAYRAWLRQAIRTQVIVAERQAITSKYEADVAAAANAVENDLGNI